MNRRALEHLIRAAAKDRRFIRDAAKHRLIDKTTVLARLAETQVPEERRAHIRDWIDFDFELAESP